MIKIGVTEGVVISKAEKNDQQTLVIGIREVGTVVKEKKEVSIIDQMSDSSDSTGSDGMGEVNFLMFRPSDKKYDKPDEAEEGKNVLAAFIDLKNQLTHFLKRFMPEKEIKWSPWAGVPVNAADAKDILAKLEIKANIERVYANYVDNFLTMVTPWLNKEDKPARLLLIRKNKDQSFGVLRKKFLDNQPFFESMDIPVNLSKLYTKEIPGKTTKFHEALEVEGIKYVPAFTDYELKKGLDDTTRSEASSESTAVNTEEIEQVNTLFSGGAEDPIGQVAADDEPTFKLEE